MKIKKLISPCLVLLYLWTVIGVGFYNCHCEHSQQLALLTHEVCECEDHHNHNNHDCDNSNCKHTNNNATCSVNDENSGCCTIVYKSINIDQEAQQSLAKQINIPTIIAVLTPFLYEDITIVNNNDLSAFNSSPPIGYKTSIIYQNRQLRL